MAIIDLFSRRSIPGWMSRTRGRRYVEICMLAADVLVEGLQQGRLALLGHDPPPDAIPHASNDRGIVAALTELPRDTALRFRRWLWSARAMGLAGVADVYFHAEDWITAGGTPPTTIGGGQPSELGNVLLIDTGGVIGTAGIEYSYSLDGGQSYPVVGVALGTDETILVGDVEVTFRAGQVIPAGTIYLDHGGRGLLLNDLGAPSRSDAAASPAGDESLLHELSKVVGACRIRLIDASGTWWTREANGFTWRLAGGPWAWDPTLDADSSYWSRGLIVIDSPPDVDPWELLSVGAHYVGEPYASYGTTATMEWWNRVSVTIGRFKPANMLVHSVILNFDSTKFDPSDASTCSQDNWYNPHEYDSLGNVTLTRPVDYAWFSSEI